MHKIDKQIHHVKGRDWIKDKIHISLKYTEKTLKRHFNRFIMETATV